MAITNVTRGYGFLEVFLARQRYKLAETLISSIQRKGRLLDIGCGFYPYFLNNIDFSEKYGLDKVVDPEYQRSFQKTGTLFLNHDIAKKDKLPFAGGYFDVVTMLAVIEHIEFDRAAGIFKEIYRIMKPGGLFILTTPAAWTGPLLRIMATLRLVSSVEITEHKAACRPKKLLLLFQEAGFIPAKLRLGYFELFMNIWATASK